MSVDAWVDAPPPTSDPLTMDTLDYHRLSRTGQRTMFDKWMDGILGPGWQQRHAVTEATLGEGCLDVTEFVFRPEGFDTRFGRLLLDDNREPVKATRRWPAPSPPPVWKPLR